MINPAIAAESQRILWLLLLSSLGVLRGGLLLLYPGWNQNLFIFINHHLSVPEAVPVWAVLTNLGDGFFLFPVTMVLFLRKPDQQKGVLIAMILLALSSHLLKEWFGAPRPAAVLGHEELSVIGPLLKTDSFPSGHAATASLLAGLGVIYLRAGLSIFLFALMLLVDLSRIVVGAHWPVDVVCGIWLGFACAAAGCWIAGKKRAAGWSRVLFIALGGLALAVLPFYENGFEQYRPVRGLALVMACLAAIGLLIESAGWYFERYPAKIPACLKELQVRGQYLFQKLLCFGLVGSTGFLIDIGAYTLFSIVFGIPHLLARGGSYWFSASWNWFWNRTLTFHDSDKARKFPQWSKYLGMCLISFIPNWGTYYLLTAQVPFFSEYPQLALIAGVGVGMCFNFFISFLVILSARFPGAEGRSGEAGK